MGFRKDLNSLILLICNMRKATFNLPIFSRNKCNNICRLLKNNMYTIDGIYYYCKISFPSLCIQDCSLWCSFQLKLISSLICFQFLSLFKITTSNYGMWYCVNSYLSHCNLSYLMVITYHIIIRICITPAPNMKQVHLAKKKRNERMNKSTNK